MIDLENFKNSVRKHFDSFLEKYDFSYYKCEYRPYSNYIFYKKKDTLLRFNYAVRHDYIEVDFFYNYPKFIPNTQDFNHSVMLLALVENQKVPKFNYDAIMPLVIGLENSLSNIKELLEFYCKDVLKGRKITFNDIRN